MVIKITDKFVLIALDNAIEALSSPSRKRSIACTSGSDGGHLHRQLRFVFHGHCALIPFETLDKWFASFHCIPRRLRQSWQSST